MIPKIIHIIWVGDVSKRPDNCIQTWIDHNPSWQVKVWGNEKLTSHGWTNAGHMREMACREMAGVADLMRWEILYEEGGFALDADSVCVRPLPDWLCETEAFACWENELMRPGLIACGYVGSEAGNPFIGQMILDIQAEASVCDRPAWISTGTQRLTNTWKKYKYQSLTLMPSHFFIPRHYSGAAYAGTGPVYAHQEWGSTVRTYDQLHGKDIQCYQTRRSDKPRITVGIVALNSADTIKEAIDTALAQNYDAFDLLIVDNGSTDATEDLVKGYVDARVRYVKTAHSAIGTARNRILAEATGEYVLWHGSSDTLMTDVIANYATLIGNWPEAVVLYGDLVEIDKAGKAGRTIRYKNYGCTTHVLLQDLFIENSLPTQGILVKTSAMREVGGFDEGLAFSEDYDLWIRIAAAGGMFIYLDRVVGNHRLRSPLTPSTRDAIRQTELHILHKTLSRYPLSQLCGDLDWKYPRSAELAAYSRAAMVAEARGGVDCAKPWRDRARSILSGYASLTTAGNRSEQRFGHLAS